MSTPNHNNSSSTPSGPREPGSQAPNGPSQQSAASVPASSQAEMAQAFKDLAKGEQHAAALEANLTNLESKLDALLASIEGGAALLDQGQDGSPASDKDGKNGSK
ncbi:hypothetical protein SLS62_005607 [Diatrype stigma]|uniref:Uncharacterized protein n=1 Tax=Diatrype stigma TaxID=117547 RepID=A0AAN9UNY0_9PEZI